MNARIDKLTAVHKEVERYARDKRDRSLDDCVVKIQQCKEEQGEANTKIQDCRDAIKAIEKEINEAGASQTNLRENLRVRKLQKEIVDIQSQIDSYDVEEAAKAKRNFQEQWDKKKDKLDRLNKAVHTLEGEMGSLESQRKVLEEDIKEFKDVNKMYTEQLVKVKISDMANNDLEKYAKALDNAIMKYHSLKMEEVNDTMKHLWNKTYQGTDIDGIKIRSDVEGGASKRSYNYRVVMTKDQVEMDMRGRCSAGQKMLASIIIRLALSDSFGQNCGILALDEPTNALDTENIDALAESLVDIINERKSHSNFQLIIITHDETFLKKLGQNDVMEYYWRVTRDARQKSVIERQRFR
ncbi:P-loop containing nucleoside triphosphate hydrolase protein [Coprinopsis marcescibilis]|uniref:P-loop containing nucleoside triphosphate hydrolase protein n=1 Tax=Coprinopsis marcescibilis TaxID=230819 RepID=A0A5C3KYQ4_COPMA|nr:P-loop containing nucleoside triphosphate hydrolase protein [Coprinopsis marcescibilis]